MSEESLSFFAFLLVRHIGCFRGSRLTGRRLFFAVLVPRRRVVRRFTLIALRGFPTCFEWGFFRFRQRWEQFFQPCFLLREPIVGGGDRGHRRRLPVVIGHDANIHDPVLIFGIAEDEGGVNVLVTPPNVATPVLDRVHAVPEKQARPLGTLQDDAVLVFRVTKKPRPCRGQEMGRPKKCWRIRNQSINQSINQSMSRTNSKAHSINQTINQSIDCSIDHYVIIFIYDKFTWRGYTDTSSFFSRPHWLIWNIAKKITIRICDVLRESVNQRLQHVVGGIGDANFVVSGAPFLDTERLVQHITGQIPALFVCHTYC